RNELREFKGELREDLREVKTRRGQLEHDIAHVHVALAEQSSRIDRLVSRTDRIERRLELAD
ncbi:MAG: hypothetical protein L0H63_08255, partial [Nitrococcus sp.]|nr:hypothetical protein [Nitrococcus sp.]